LINNDKKDVRVVRDVIPIKNAKIRKDKSYFDLMDLLSRKGSRKKPNGRIINS